MRQDMSQDSTTLDAMRLKRFASKMQLMPHEISRWKLTDKRENGDGRLYPKTNDKGSG